MINRHTHPQTDTTENSTFAALIAVWVQDNDRFALLKLQKWAVNYCVSRNVLMGK